MACLPLDQAFREGVERGDLRTARNLEQAILPEGAVWAHVLDAEPLALATMGDGFCFCFMESRNLCFRCKWSRTLEIATTRMA